MVSKGSDKYVIWPVYFDKNTARKNGRRVPKNLSIDNPTVQDIYRTAQSLDLSPIIEDKSYPSTWWTKGRVLVEQKGSKIEVIQSIAQRLLNRKQK